VGPRFCGLDGSPGLYEQGSARSKIKVGLPPRGRPRYRELACSKASGHRSVTVDSCQPVSLARQCEAGAPAELDQPSAIAGTPSLGECSGVVGARDPRCASARFMLGARSP
jgi:hypothetical protein